MKARYASGKQTITKVVTRQDGTATVYKARPLSALSTSVEGMKLLKVLTPSLGAGIDSLVGKDSSVMQLDGNSYTLTTMFTMFSENLTDEHFIDIQDKLLGSLIVDDKEVENVDDHFSEGNIEDLMEVLMWLFKENFYSFFMGSALLRTRIASLMEAMSPQLKDSLQKGLTMLKTGTEQPPTNT